MSYALVVKGKVNFIEFIVLSKFENLLPSITTPSQFVFWSSAWGFIRCTGTIQFWILYLLRAGDFRYWEWIIEVENQQSPTTAETLDATRRVDDATVAIRSAINNLFRNYLEVLDCTIRTFESSLGCLFLVGLVVSGEWNTRRVEDATVAIRSAINNFRVEL
uniref:Coat protein n=1 Tax=Tomato mosaic virus TaxID=12253 RepID=Q91KP8_9VIRU|nr:coat protein [Tomato mosaic virus]